MTEDAPASGARDCPPERGSAGGPDPTRLVADADVLAADLLVGDAARVALDAVRAHSWMALVASDPLLDDAEAVVAALADPPLASGWRERVADLATLVDHPPGDHPALASALHGNAAHVLTFEESLQTARAGAEVKRHVETSVTAPEAFASVFDAATLYEGVVGESYPGPDRDPRA